MLMATASMLVFGVILGMIVVWVCKLQRKYFHYSLDKHYMNFSQGIITKQQRQIPYAVVQNIIIEQSLYDRICNMATLTLENASQGGGALQALDPSYQSGSTMSIGSIGNRVIIPGLATEDAHNLKNDILQKMKDNPAINSRSGL